MKHRTVSNGWVLVLLSLGLQSAGCVAFTHDWQYPPDPPGTLLSGKAPTSSPAKVVVKPFRDARGEKVEEESWKVLIPFYPYAADAYDRPETAREGGATANVNPSKDFARALADELRNTGLFSSVTYSESEGTDGADMVLTGTIRSSNGRRTLTTYLLGPVGTIFWILGLPMGNAASVVEMDVQLSDASNQARAFWMYSMQFKAERLVGLYYGRQGAVQNYPTAVQETLRPALENLIKISAERPELLKPAGRSK